MAAIEYTVLDAIIAFGVDNATLFNGNTVAQRIAEELFDNDFHACIDKDDSEMGEDFKTYAGLTVAQGQIRLMPGTKRQIRSFVQWAKDQLRTGQNPSETPFPVADTAVLIRRHKSHLAFCEKSKRVSESAKPSQFTEKTKWLDWFPTLVNFLKNLPGRNGVPLVYVIRDSDDAIIDLHTDMLQDYINRAPLEGEAFIADASEVHTYIVNITAGNETAESKLLSISDQSNGRLDIKALREHFEGVGINAITIRDADNVIENLQYTGERKPTMWWDEFERKLTMSFNVYDKKEKRQVYSEEMKLRILCRKVNADFLEATRQLINVDLTRTPVTITYAQALAAFRNEVNRKFPTHMTTTERTRRMAEMDTYYNQGRGGIGRHYGRGGRGRGRQGGRGQGRARRRPENIRTITGLDGQQLEVHPSYNFNAEDWHNIPSDEKNRLIQERQQYNANKRRRVNELQVTNRDEEAGSSVKQEQETRRGNIMGGRNEQEAMRNANRKEHEPL